MDGRIKRVLDYLIGIFKLPAPLDFRDTQTLFLQHRLLQLSVLFLFCSFGILCLRVSNSSGFYTFITKDIVVFGSNDIHDMLDTCTHETGHYIYYNMLSKEERKEWINLSLNSTYNEYVTSYARTNPSEDFAESFMFSFKHYYDSWMLDIRSKQKKKFMDNVYKDILNNTG